MGEKHWSYVQCYALLICLEPSSEADTARRSSSLFWAAPEEILEQVTKKRGNCRTSAGFKPSTIERNIRGVSFVPLGSVVDVFVEHQTKCPCGRMRRQGRGTPEPILFWKDIGAHFLARPSTNLTWRCLFFIFILKKTKFQKYMSNREIFKNGCLSPP